MRCNRCNWKTERGKKRGKEARKEEAKELEWRGEKMWKETTVSGRWCCARKREEGRRKKGKKKKKKKKKRLLLALQMGGDRVRVEG